LVFKNFLTDKEGSLTEASHVLADFVNHRPYTYTVVPPAKGLALSRHPPHGRAVDTAHGYRMALPLLCLCYWAEGSCY